MGARFAITVTCTVAASLAALGAEAPPEPDSYRVEEYRAPTPATLKGAHVLTTREAHEIWQKGAASFVDVLPQAPRPANLGPEVVWRDKPRFDIPGSLWLPDTGYGALAPIMESILPLRPSQGDRRRSEQSDRILLPARLLDVLECRKTGDGAWLSQSRVVPGGNRRLVGRRSAARKTQARAEALNRNERSGQAGDQSNESTKLAQRNVSSLDPNHPPGATHFRAPANWRSESAAKERFARRGRLRQFAARSASASRRHIGSSCADRRKRAGPTANALG